MESKEFQTRDEVVGEDEESDDSDNMVYIRTSKKKAKKPSSLNNSDQEMTCRKKNNNSGITPRSSDRLKAKSNRKNAIPNRKEALNKISDGRSDGSENYEKKILKPRNLTSDFVMGRSRYVTDRTGVFESSDSDLSDFIDDSAKKPVKVVPKKRKRKKIKKVEEEKNSCDSMYCSENESISGWKKTKSKHGENVESSRSSSYDSDIQVSNRRKLKSRKSPVISDDEKLKEEDGEEILSLGKSKKKQAPFELESDDENNSHSSSRIINLRGRSKSIQKEKKEELLAKISAKRNLAKLKPAKANYTDVVSGQVEQEIGNESESDDNFDNILDSSELEERDSDREFVVEDSSCDVNSDAVAEFYRHLHSSEDVPVYGSNLLASPKKKLNNFQRIQSLYESEESDDDTSSCHMVAITDAVKEDNVDLVKTLVECNPNIIHEVGSKRQSLLHTAVICGSLEVVRLLLDFDSDKLALDALSLPPIAYAILYGYTKCLKILLHDTDLNKVNKILQDHLKCSLLHFVVYGRILLSCHTVSCNSMTDILKMLFESDQSLCLNLMESVDSQGFTPLAAAIVAGQHQCVEYFVKHGASTSDFQGSNGGNLLHFAIECSTNGKKEEEEEPEKNKPCYLILHILLSTNLKNGIDAVDDCDFTPLMCAAQSGNHDCVLVLLESGASVHCKDKDETTSLHLAAASGDTTCVKLLLEYGHKVDCLDSFGWPPLLYANFTAQESCVLSLMEPNPKQIFVLGDLLRRGKSKAAKERNFKVIKDVLIALANQDAYYRVFNDFIRYNPDFLEEYDKGLLHDTWIAILDFDNKQRWFKRKLVDARRGHCKHISLEVNRDSIFADAMQVLKGYSGSAMRNCNFSVTFRNEPGICTGPKREFFTNICKDIVEPCRQLFYVTDNNQYSLVPKAFFAEQAKKDGERNNDGSLRHQNNNKLVSSLDDVCEEENGSDDGHSDVLNEENLLEINNEIATLNEDYMDEDGDAVIAELDLAELNNNLSSHVRELPATSSNNAASNISCKQSAENRLKNSELVDQKLAQHLEQLKSLGRIIGLAICQGHFLNLHLSKPLVKQILGIDLSHPDDLSYLDYELHKNLVSYILENDDIDDEFLPCDLNVINPWNDCPSTVKLFPKDKDEEFITSKNKVEFVELVSKYKLSVLIEKEIDFLCRGLYEVISKEFFNLFTADELSLLINGVDKIDVDDWRKNTVYSGSNTEKRNEVKWFWEIVSKLKQEEKALLLKFSTGSPCLPAGGFAELRGLNGTTKFHMTVTSERNKIPTASTCFNKLKLTSYDNAKEIKDKLLIAIRHGTEGFSFS